jgi:hypothetical protein
MEPLTKEKCQELSDNNNLIELEAKETIDWFTHVIRGKFKVWIHPVDHDIYIMAPRATRRGILFYRLKDPRFKIVR